ncbi:MAG: hypothetical protein ACK40L_02475 [Hydrogenophaga sp.]
MDSNESPADINMVEDFQNLHVLMFDDVSGENTRLIAEYFQEAADKVSEIMAGYTSDDEKNLGIAVKSAFDAARRIVLKTWERCHGSELVA